MISTQYLDDLTAAQSLETVWDMHCREMARYGFDRLLYGFTRYRYGTSLGDPDDFVLLTNHDRAYTDQFIGSGLFLNAPMVNWALENDGACSWGVVGERLQRDELTAAEKSVMEFNLAQGVSAGYSISFKSLSMRAKGAVALTGRAGLSQRDVDAIWADHGSEIIVLNNIVHLKVMTLPYHGPSRGLTARQREALEWVGDGKTTQDIAVLMGLTQATVEKHLRLAREALSIETTAQAVLKAAFQNQMFIVHS